MSTSSYDPYFNPSAYPASDAFRTASPADTPPGAEARLEDYRDDLEQATAQLAQARDDELEAEEARDSKLREGQFHEDCPKVGVKDGVRTTVAYQKAWIEDYAKKEERDFRVARVARQAAQAHLRKVEKQGGFQQSVVASVRETYRTSGGRYGS